MPFFIMSDPPDIFGCIVVISLVLCLLPPTADSLSMYTNYYQPNENRHCLHLMGVGATILSTSITESSLSDFPNRLQLREKCADFCIKKQSACIGFNLPPAGTFCIMASPGCSLTPSSTWTFFRKLKQPGIQESTIAPTAGIFQNHSIRRPTLTLPVTLLPIPPSQANPRQSQFLQVEVNPATGRSVIADYFNVLATTYCKMSLRNGRFFNMTAGLAGCAEMCINNSSCSGFNILTTDRFTAENPSSFCQLLFRKGCSITHEPGWYFFIKKANASQNSVPPIAGIGTVTGYSHFSQSTTAPSDIIVNAFTTPVPRKSSTLLSEGGPLWYSTRSVATVRSRSTHRATARTTFFSPVKQSTSRTFMPNFPSVFNLTIVPRPTTSNPLSPVASETTVVSIQFTSVPISDRPPASTITPRAVELTTVDGANSTASHFFENSDPTSATYTNTTIVPSEMPGDVDTKTPRSTKTTTLTDIVFTSLSENNEVAATAPVSGSSESTIASPSMLPSRGDSTSRKTSVSMTTVATVSNNGTNVTLAASPQKSNNASSSEKITGKRLILIALAIYCVSIIAT